MSTRCCTPKRWPVRATADSAFCAAIVASQVAIGSRQVSQLPQLPEAVPRRSSAAERSGGRRSSHSRRAGHRAFVARPSSSPAAHRRARSWPAAARRRRDRRPSRRRPAGRRARRGRSPDDRPRGSWANPCGRRSAHPACRSPCRRRPSRRRPRPPPRGNAGALAGGPRRRVRHDRRAPSLPCRRGEPRSSPPWRARAGRRCRRRRDARRRERRAI